MWLVFTGFLIAAYVINIPKGYNQELLVLGLCYLFFSLYMMFCYVPTTVVTKPWNACINAISNFICSLMGATIRKIVYAFLVFVIIAATIFSFPEKDESPRLKRLISLFGMFVFLAGAYVLSAVKYYYCKTIKRQILINFIAS